MKQKRRKMGNLYLAFINIFLNVVLSVVGGGMSETIKCPRYCMCYLNITDNMRSVSCVARRLDNIDLSVPKRVQRLDLSNNSISVLEDRGFQKLELVEIVKLVMQHNSIRTIGLHSFAGLTYLQWVDLTANNLYQILPWTFHDNSNLKFISLSGNPLGHIKSSGPFLDVPSLEVLELSNCNFAHFPEDFFSALPNIRRVDISHNQLISFDIYSLQFLYKLEELDVSINPWPCNANLRNLKEFLLSKSSKLIGSSCDLPKYIQKPQIEEKRFEKMLSVGVIYPNYDDLDNSDDSSIEETSNEELNKCNCKTESNTALLYSNNNILLPPKWMILVSFQLGVCTTLFVGYIWTYFTKLNGQYQTLQPEIPIIPAVTELQSSLVLSVETEEQLTQTSTEEIISCPETPPPTYRELFISSP